MARIGYIIRTEHFSSAHRLHASQLSDAQNAQIYGKCNRANYHGHNYVRKCLVFVFLKGCLFLFWFSWSRLTRTVNVTLRGPIDPINGMIMNLTDLKSCLTKILDSLDHRNLDLDVPFFKDTPRYAHTKLTRLQYCWESGGLHLGITLACGSSRVFVWSQGSRNSK